MPRTKVNRGLTTKRVRDNTSEIDDILRDFDIEYENSLQQIRQTHEQNLFDADLEIDNLKNQLGPNILQMTMGELRKHKIYQDIEDAVHTNMNELNMTIKETLKETMLQKHDDGYSTGKASSEKSQFSDSENNPVIPSAHKPKVSTLSSLKTFKHRRRSQSASNLPTHTTPGPRSVMKFKTPNVKNGEIPSSAHMSRSKLRAPLSQLNNRRAASADRITTITPKVNPHAPVAVLRHAKPGEVAFSVSGSPIMPSQSSGTSVNMNIPFGNGILHIRPEHLDAAQLDTTLMKNAVGSSIGDMRTLQDALNIIVSSFEKRQKKH